MSGSRRVRLALLFCLPIWFAGAVHAQPDAGQAQAEEARALFTQGLEFVELEDWVQAEERFRRVLALRSSHVASYNLASALAHLSRLVEATELLRSIQRATDVDAATREAAQQLLLEIEPRIGSLTVRISGDISGARFTLDAKPVELTAQVQTISVDPGEHVLSAQRGAEQLAEARVVVGGAAPLQAECALELPAQLAPERALRPSSAVPSDARARTADADGGPRDALDSGGPAWWLWAAGGVAVAAAAVVAVVLVTSGSAATPVAGDTDPPLVRGRVR